MVSIVTCVHGHPHLFMFISVCTYCLLSISNIIVKSPIIHIVNRSSGNVHKPERLKQPRDSEEHAVCRYIGKHRLTSVIYLLQNIDIALGNSQEVFLRPTMDLYGEPWEASVRNDPIRQCSNNR